MEMHRKSVRLESRCVCVCVCVRALWSLRAQWIFGTGLHSGLGAGWLFASWLLKRL